MNPNQQNRQVHSQNIVACVWDFDKTLIPGYMQRPLFDYYNVDEKVFWSEVNQLPKLYFKRGMNVSSDTIYLNHLLSYVKNGPMRGLTNQKLEDLGNAIEFYPGLPEFFTELADIPKMDEFADYDFKVEHYIISTGISKIIKGSKIAPYVDGIFACEFIESPLPPNFMSQTEFSLPLELEISQVGKTVDNTIKTRYIFEINKGSNKNPKIDVNSFIPHEDRRIPMDQMIYVADGPSDVPVFTVLRQMGGKTYAVYNPENEKEFVQTCDLVERSRVHNNGPADYRKSSPTSIWMKQKTTEILRNMVKKRTDQLNQRTGHPPTHIQESQYESSSHPNRQETFWK